MKNKNIIWMLLMICSSTIFAQKPTSKLASLEVIVVDSITKKPIEFARVSIKSNYFIRPKYTNQNGIVFFESLLPETSVLSVSFNDYQKINIDLDLREGKSEQRKILLLQSSQVLTRKAMPKNKPTPTINTIQGITRSCFGESSLNYFKDSILRNVDSGKEGCFSNGNNHSNNQNENNQVDSLNKNIFLKISCVATNSYTFNKPNNFILRAPNPNINMIAAYKRGVDSRNGEVPSIRGARPENTAYYLDGVRISNPLTE